MVRSNGLYDSDHCELITKDLFVDATNQSDQSAASLIDIAIDLGS